MRLLSELKHVVTDQRDIVWVLAAQGWGRVARGEEGQLIFTTAGTPPEVFAEAWTEHGLVTRLEPGSSLRTQDAERTLIERARFESAHSHGFTVYRRTLFSRLPISGSFRWGDSVQLRPCSGDIAIDEPQGWMLDRDVLRSLLPRHDGPPFPMILEVRVPKSPNRWIEENRWRQRLDFWQNTFAVFVPGDIGYWQIGHPDHVWTSVIEDGVARNRLAMQAFSGEPTQSSALADPEPAALDRSENFYDRISSTFSELTFPDSLPNDLGVLEKLSDDERSAFARASYWFSVGVRARSEQNRAVAIVAFSAAVECLLPKLKASKCPCCGKTKRPSITNLFKRHLSKFATAPNKELENIQKRLYDTRSALVHGSYAPDIDIGPFSPARDDTTHSSLEWWARKSLINWVRASDRSKWHEQEGSSGGVTPSKDA